MLAEVDERQSLECVEIISPRRHVESVGLSPRLPARPEREPYIMMIGDQRGARQQRKFLRFARAVLSTTPRVYPARDSE